MKVLFFDILNSSNNKLYKIVKDFKKLDKTYIYLNKKVLKSFLFRNFFKVMFKIKFKDEYLCVFSKSIEKSKLKEYIIEIIKDNINIVSVLNTKLKNGKKYLKDLDKKSNLLLVINNPLDIQYIKQYILDFKHIDILNVNNNINEKHIKDINYEYGTNINVINRKYLTKYDIYVIFSKINLFNYSLNKSAIIVDLLDYEDDIFSVEYKLYIKNKEEFIESERYSSRKLGKVIYLQRE